MIIGFTGTQRGMTEHQKVEVKRLLDSYMHQVSGVHHGGCIGADAEFHNICLTYGLGSLMPTVHPASDIEPSKVADLQGPTDYTLPKPALIRNRMIVEVSDVLIAAPGQEREVLRSGTWATIRYARKCYTNEPGKSIHIVFP